MRETSITLTDNAPVVRLDMPDLESIISQFTISRDYRGLSAYTVSSTIMRYVRFCRAGNPSHPVAYRQYLLALGRKPTYIANQFSILRTFIDYLVSTGAVSHNPFSSVMVRHRESDYSRTGLSLEQAKKLLEVAEGMGLRPRAIINLMLRTGLRIQAVRDANVDDIDCSQTPFRLFVRHKGRVDKKEWVLLYPGAWRPLEDYLKKRYWSNNALFVSEYHPHERIGSVTIYRDITEALGLAGIVGKTPHDLRHTAITLARQAGVPLDAVREMAGHADPATTLRYDHSVQRLLGVPEEALENVLSVEGETKNV